MRLNQWLVKAGAAPARRKADALIASGAITINDEVARLGQVVAEGDDVKVHGRPLQRKEQQPKVLLLHKPAGVLSSHQSQGGAQTVFDILPPEYGGWKIVGRLDRYSEGLLVLTNDGDVAQALSHPSGGHKKYYQVWLDRPLASADEARLLAGVKLDEGASKIGDWQKQSDGSYTLSLKTGWNRQIRRTFEAVGYRVKRLVRSQLGAYSLGDLAVGQWREDEV